MARVLVTGSAGFIGGYLVAELLSRGHQVTGLDNYSKYGPVARSYDDHPGYRFLAGDARDAGLLTELLAGCDHFIAGAAMIGGISYFHSYPYDLLATNERIAAAACDAAIAAHRDGRLRKVTYLSSSMVFESTTRWPSREGDERSVPPPRSSYGFQKLAVEYFARAAFDQYRLPYTIVRPFNCVGVGEARAQGEIEVASGNVKLAMSHVVPDLVQKVVKGQDPLHLLGDGTQLRHYTYGGDLARGIVTAMEHPAATNQDFNLSTAESTTVLRLADLIWRKINGPRTPLRWVSDEPFAHDVARRVPDVTKAREVLGFEATTPLDSMLDEVIPWVTEAVHQGRLAGEQRAAAVSRLVSSGTTTADAPARGPRDRIAPLFPTTAPTPTGRWRHGGLRGAGLRGAGLAGAAVAVGTVVSLARQPGAGALDTVWAEDGEIFLADAVAQPVTEALAGSYAGYFHTAPRLLAEVAAAAPAAWAAAVLATSAAMVTAALAVLVYAASAAHLPSRPARVVVAAIVVVPPLAQQDVPNSLANLHWPALYALFWILLWTPTRRPAAAVALATTALTATSDILAAALLPLALVRVAARGDRYSAALAAVLTSGIALQLLGLLTGASTRDTDLDPVRAGTGYVLRAVPAALLGTRWLGDDHTSARWLALAAAAWLLIVAAVLAAVWSTHRGHTRAAWALAGAAAVHSVALYTLPVLLTGVATGRYALAPAMLLVVALVALLPPMRGRAGAAGVLLIVLLTVVCTVNLRAPNIRAEGPSWADQLERARIACAEPTGQHVRLRVAPVNATWHAELPCTYLVR